MPLALVFCFLCRGEIRVGGRVRAEPAPSAAVRIGNSFWERDDMRVVDVDGEFVGFVRQIVNQQLIIGRPSASDAHVSMAACQITADRVKLHISAAELAKMAGPQPSDRDSTTYPRQAGLYPALRPRLRLDGDQESR